MPDPDTAPKRLDRVLSGPARLNHGQGARHGCVGAESKRHHEDGQQPMAFAGTPLATNSLTRFSSRARFVPIFIPTSWRSWSEAPARASPLKSASRNISAALPSSRKESSRHTSSTVRESSGRVSPPCGGGALIQTLLEKTMWHSPEAMQESPPGTKACVAQCGEAPRNYCSTGH